MKKQRDPSFTTGTPFIILLDDSINNILKNKVIDKSNVYRSDISDYIYDLDVNLISDL